MSDLHVTPELLAEVGDSLLASVNRALPLLEDVRQVGLKVDLAAAEVASVKEDVRRLVTAVEGMRGSLDGVREGLAELAAAFAQHAADEGSHPWLRAVPANGGGL